MKEGLVPPSSEWRKNLQQSSEKCKTSSPKFEFAIHAIDFSFT